MNRSIRVLCIAAVLTLGSGGPTLAQGPESGGGGGTSGGTGGDKARSGHTDGPETGGGGGKSQSAPRAGHERAPSADRSHEKAPAKRAAPASAERPSRDPVAR
jgi:hypothetical protein